MHAPRIINISKSHFIGMRVEMSFSNNQTAKLWKSFMPRKMEIEGVLDEALYSLEVFPNGFFEAFDPIVHYEKWAAVKVNAEAKASDGMEYLAVPEGNYAIFIHRGPASEAPKTYQYIFQKWLPNSGYQIDDRPHFAVMGEKYKNDDPESEEEIWIPIKK
ncbi:GyrI-like domain-containing protein [Echinicola sp. CAU 1574]|uniref:GyrI-like domain-containing protein n=1 Tax=Echinicola arenosa TaxID=2774144 RepID=A0ABR9AJ98_9BACT|nr:GyrI-like domain-containing protein [Echinicola arenosa]MBD8488876.1 GyrI-like domain-containing protein [Echinicola arenosa]